MEFPGISGDDIEWLQDQFVKSIKVRLLVDQNKTTNDNCKELNITSKRILKSSSREELKCRLASAIVLKI